MHCILNFPNYHIASIYILSDMTTCADTPYTQFLVLCTCRNAVLLVRQAEVQWSLYILLAVRALLEFVKKRYTSTVSFLNPRFYLLIIYHYSFLYWTCTLICTINLAKIWTLILPSLKFILNCSWAQMFGSSQHFGICFSS